VYDPTTVDQAVALTSDTTDPAPSLPNAGDSPMILRLRRPGTALFVLALALPAVAQNEQPAPQPSQDKPAADKPAADKPAAQRPAAQQAPAAGTQDANKQRPNAQQAPAPGAQDPGKPRPAAAAAAAMDPAKRDELLRKLAADEAAHRDHMAKLKRLDELAKAKKDDARTAQIADLVKKENQRYAAHREQARKLFGDKAYRAVDERLATGRERASETALKKERAAQRKEARGATQPDAGQAGQAAGREGKKGKGKAAGGDKPAAPPAGGDEPKADGQQRGDGQPKGDAQQGAAGQPQQPKANGQVRGERQVQGGRPAGGDDKVARGNGQARSNDDGQKRSQPRKAGKAAPRANKPRGR
jgi:hypothetical protein